MTVCGPPRWDRGRSSKDWAVAATDTRRPADFKLAPDDSHCICPAGKRLYANGSDCTTRGYANRRFGGAERDCLPCEHRSRCLRHPAKTKTRQVAFFLGKREGRESHTDRMKTRIDSHIGREMIARRFATVEPVFGNLGHNKGLDRFTLRGREKVDGLRHNKGLDRFTLRGREKVDGRWKLYCLMHNIEKLAHHGYAQ